jgi:hypothetical protein
VVVIGNDHLAPDKNTVTDIDSLCACYVVPAAHTHIPANHNPRAKLLTGVEGDGLKPQSLRSGKLLSYGHMAQATKMTTGTKGDRRAPEFSG